MSRLCFDKSHQKLACFLVRKAEMRKTKRVLRLLSCVKIVFLFLLQKDSIESFLFTLVQNFDYVCFNLKKILHESLFLFHLLIATTHGRNFCMKGCLVVQKNQSYFLLLSNLFVITNFYRFLF